MKKRVFLALLAAAAVTFVGCSKDDDGPDEGPQTYTITFEGDDWSPLVVANYNGGKAVSYTHLDVYKRQMIYRLLARAKKLDKNTIR